MLELHYETCMPVIHRGSRCTRTCTAFFNWEAASACEFCVVASSARCEPSASIAPFVAASLPCSDRSCLRCRLIVSAVQRFHARAACTRLQHEGAALEGMAGLR